eukprot:7412593-Pyramimonas_sp.AAC.1
MARPSTQSCSVSRGHDLGGNIEGSLYGPLPHPLQMAGCEEVYALLVALRFLGPTVTTIATDCNMVLDSWSKGPLQDLSDICSSEL